MNKRPERQGIMLAHPATEPKVTKLPQTILVQPKLRGERCWIAYQDEYSCLVSSYTNPFYFLDHIQKELDILGQNELNFSYDGELYKHGWTQERINSAANRSVNRNPDSGNLEYHIFDIKWSDILQKERSLILLDKVTSLIDYLSLKYIKVVPTYAIRKDIWESYTSHFTDQGYEGIILRNPEGLYEEKRSNNLLKYKPTEMDTYEIVEVLQAFDKYKKPKGMIGSFLVKTDKNNKTDVFRVGAGKLDHDKRIKYWKLKHALIGKMLIVKHEKIKTENEIPLCCVTVDIQK